MKKRFISMLNAVRETAPLVHCITSPIAINDCANAVLAVGAKPIMAEHIEEVAEITASADALALNLGSITEARLKAIMRSAKSAYENKVPFVLDLVGVTCSSLRRKTDAEIIRSFKPSIIKGNSAEIRCMSGVEYFAKGVDALTECDETLANIQIAKALSQSTGATVLVSGKTDIVADKNRCVLVENGTALMSSVTGTGCVQGVLCAVYLTQGNSFEATAMGATVMGICGEIAYKKDIGTATYHMAILDKMSLLTADAFSHLKMTEV